MALLYFVDEDSRGEKNYMSKVAAHRYIAKVQRKAQDNLELAERWGAKAVEFEKERNVLAEKLRTRNILVGVLVGYDVLLTIIWCVAHYAG